MDNAHILLIALKVIVALGILNVWLLRSGKPTAYRGGAAKTLRAEFATYGLPAWSFFAIGGLKVALALALLISIPYPSLTQPAAITLGLLILFTLILSIKMIIGLTYLIKYKCIISKKEDKAN